MTAIEPTAVPDPTEHDSGEPVDVLTMFEALESAFWWVAVGALPLTIHPRGFADLPNRALSLYQLRVRLASPAVSRESRAAIWSYLVRQARTQGPQQMDWTIATAGLALPELLRIVASLARDHNAQPGKGCDVADLEAAALGAFYHELRRTDLDNTRDPRIRSRLFMAAYRAARTVRDTSGHTPASTGTDAGDGAGDGAGQTAPHAPARTAGRPYSRSTARKLQRARGQAQQARLARQQAGRTRGGQVRP